MAFRTQSIPTRFTSALATTVALVAMYGWLGSSGIHAEEYLLEIPGDPNRSVAHMFRNDLVIVDAAGQRYRYQSHRESNSPDGRFIGYYSPEANKYIRWPITNSGAMYLGSVEGGRLSWRQSQMQIRPARGVPTRPGDVMLPRPGEYLPHRDWADWRQGTRRGAMQLAGLTVGDRAILAQIDTDGDLNYFVGRAGQWGHREARLRTRLPPGASLILVDDPNDEFPTTYVVNQSGRLVMVDRGERVRELPDRGVRFPPGGHIASLRHGFSTDLVLADVRGRLWFVDPDNGTYELLDAQPDLFEPGTPVVTIADDFADFVFAIDRRGYLLGYQGAGGSWSRPFAVGSGFVAGGNLDATRLTQDGFPVIAVAAVDSRGQLHVFEDAGSGWGDDSPNEFRLTPGTPLAISSSGANITMSAIGTDGNWLAWRRRNGFWSKQAIASGFHPGVSVLLEPPYAFAVDPLGRPIAARYWNNAWDLSVCVPRADVAPRLGQRNIVPAEPLPPAEVVFQNRHNEELVVRLFRVSGGPPLEMVLPPGESATQVIERDAGGILEESHIVRGPGGEPIQENRRVRIPPKSLYNVVVYANRVTSLYFDRTQNRSNIPDESNTSLVSLGVFPLPPGELLRDGQLIDVYREAMVQRNPGAASLLDRQPTP